MTNKTYLYGNRDLKVENADKTKGFTLTTYIKSDITFGMLVVTMYNIGNCNENDEIIILFDNGEKITQKSWKKFNCEGIAYFNLKDNEIELLKTQPISKIRVTNGRSYDSYTGDVTSKDKRYFIQLFYALNNKLTVESK